MLPTARSWGPLLRKRPCLIEVLIGSAVMALVAIGHLACLVKESSDPDVLPAFVSPVMVFDALALDALRWCF